MKRILYVLLLVFGLLASAWADGSRYASESVLNSGKWVKIRVAEDGIYKLTLSDLKKMGFSALDKVAVYGYGGWPLDEDFSTAYIDDVPDAGLSTMGLVPFASSFAMFASGRAFEQIRNSIGYPHLNVKIGATHAGISVGEDGASHQCCEDFALMRSIPGMVVICPADDVEAKQAVKAAYKYEGPVYLRFGRLAVPVFHDESYKFEIGKGEVVKEGNDVTIIANGLMVAEAIEAGKVLEADGINAEIINIATIKPLDEELVVASAEKTGRVITVEEHSIIGGLGEAVCACLSEKCPTPVKRIGVNDEFGHSGPAKDLLKQFGLSAENIVKVTKEFVK